MSEYDCEPCGRHFRLFGHYQAHLLHSARHHYCAPCARDFGSESAKAAHLRHSERHLVCKWCQTTVGKLRAHNKSYHEQCAGCSEWFGNAAEVHDHCRSSHSEVYCAPCKRLFRDSNCLRMHRRSAVHSAKDFRCPGRGCGRGFVSRSALIQHFEADACPSGVDLEDVDKEFSRHCDVDGQFVRKNRIFSAPRTGISVAEDGRFRCTRCPKEVRTQGQLSRHIWSPKHKNRGHKAYVCPFRDCRKDGFYSLASLVLHLETSDCGDHFEDVLVELVDKLLDILEEY